MQCYKHPEHAATAQCNECGRALCNDCANLFSPPLCVGCAKEYSNRTKSEMIKNIAISIVLMIVGIIVIQNPLGILLAGIPYGWAILNRITPSMFLWMSWVGWLIYFFIKFIIAYFIGVFALPFKLFQWISELRRVNRLLETVGE